MDINEILVLAFVLTFILAALILRRMRSGVEKNMRSMQSFTGFRVSRQKKSARRN